ncbi:MAG: hypothetical protein SWC96_12285 [Thermodesulfobacteriota bacterium]|nr:hypothetical protein [Thermodesulfobacteriota bacterium]
MMFRKIALILVPVLLAGAMHAYGDYKDDIGHTRLSGELGEALPDGTGIAVTQVEAFYNGHWMPDTGHSDFTGKTITDKITPPDTGTSSHATSVGRNFYGNSLSLGPGITTIDVYEANNWFQTGFLNLGQPEPPGSSSSRIANHSYVGGLDGGNIDSQALRRLDWVIEENGYIQCVGLTGAPLLGSAFNAITVGSTYGSLSRTSVSLVDSYGDTVYEPVRIKPDLMAPLGSQSATTALGSSAIALLLDAGDAPGRPDLLNAGHPEVVKAALMAGASRRTACKCDDGYYIGDYRADAADRADNGLDKRLGAGQLNIYESYHIIAAGEQNSGGSIGVYGFDYNPAFGGLEGSSTTETYAFTADADHSRLIVALVWHVDIDGGAPDAFNGAATYHNMDLVLYDATDSREAASARSAWDNTEHLWAPVTAGHQYEIRVQKGTGQADFLWDYGLAWRLVPDAPGDQDGDGLPDTWETQYGLNPADSMDALSDGDADDLTGLEEYCRGTDPAKTDTDGDGMADGAEFDLWQDSCADSDGDGPVNLVDADSDNDGINDGPEYEYWGDNWDKDIDGDGLYNLIDPDADGDGGLDGIEIAGGFDPADPASHCESVPAISSGGAVCVLLGLVAMGWFSAVKRAARS